MGYDPTQAGDPIPRKFKNVLKCIADEIITMAEAVAQGRYRQLPEGVGQNEPYWDLAFETLDAKRTDGTALTVVTAGRLFTKEGKQQDNTQRPYRLAVAFAGMGVSVFPGDPDGKFDAFCAGIGVDAIGTNPSYDASKVVGRVFLVEMEPMEIGRDMPLPITAEPEGYIYTGKVREVKPREDSVNPDGSAAPASNNLVDITKPGGEEALKQVLGILDGQAADADLFDLLRTGGLDNRTLLDGESLLGIAVNDGALIAKLGGELGHFTVTEDGKISVSTS
jgi:hypothetical protein